MKTLTATEMGFPQDYRTYNLSVALKGGYSVGNANDAYPDIQKVDQDKDTVTLYQTFAAGTTWTPVGEFRKNELGGWTLSWYDKKEGEYDL
jgi:hypothetical protein